MIKNNKQLTQSKELLNSLIEFRASLEVPMSLTEKAQIGALECQIEDLTHDIHEFEDIIEKGIKGISFNSSNLEKAVISLRIASGITQKELAERIGIAEQQVQRYEDQNYLKASFERIIQIITSITDQVSLQFQEEKEVNKVASLFNIDENIQKKNNIGNESRFAT